MFACFWRTYSNTEDTVKCTVVLHSTDFDHSLPLCREFLGLGCYGLFVLDNTIS